MMDGNKYRAMLNSKLQFVQ